MKPTILLLMIGYLVSFKGFSQSAIQAQLRDYIVSVVAKDGSGQYTTVQAAINAFPNNNANPRVIFVKNGTYTEKVEIPSGKTNLILVGEDVSATIITYNDYSGSGKIYNGIITNANGAAIGTSTSHTLYTAASDFTMMNITIRNSAGNVGQAVAFNAQGDRHFLYHCRLIGYQDTYYTWSAGRSYVKDTYIEGAVDYIFGRGVAFFDSCQLHSLRSGGYITAASTEENFKYGYVFSNCKLTSASGQSGIFLGRPWRPYANTVFINSEIGSFISAGGWSAWSGNTNHQTCFYAEYKNCGAGSGVSGRVSWSRQLTDAVAANYTKTKVFDRNVNPSPYSVSWNPVPEENPVYNVVRRNVNPIISAACFSSSCTARNWYRDTDGDGKGDPASVIASCTQPVGYVADNTDLCPTDPAKSAPGQCGCGIPESSCTDCSGVKDGTAYLDICDRCVGGATGKVACISTAEAEDQACSYEGIFESKNAGFKGNGYINVDNAIGTGIQFNVNVEEEGNHTMSFRYANGGAGDRTADITIDGTLVKSLSFPSTSSFTTYKTVDVQLFLTTGVHSLELVSAKSDGLANIDQIGYVSSGINPHNCLVTSTRKYDKISIEVYPNPFTGTFLLKTTELSEYELYNYQGHIVLSGKTIGNIVLGDNLPEGIYMIKVSGHQGSVIRKLIKE